MGEHRHQPEGGQPAGGGGGGGETAEPPPGRPPHDRPGGQRQGHEHGQDQGGDQMRDEEAGAGHGGEGRPPPGRTVPGPVDRADDGAERHTEQDRSDLVRYEPDGEEPLEARAVGARDEQRQHGRQPRRRARQPVRPGQERHRRREGGHGGDADHLQGPRGGQGAEGHRPEKGQEPGQARPVEEELLLAEDEAGEPAVGPEMGDQVGDGEVGPDQVGHHVLAGRRPPPDHMAHEHQRQRHTEGRPGHPGRSQAAPGARTAPGGAVGGGEIGLRLGGDRAGSEHPRMLCPERGQPIRPGGRGGGARNRR